MAQVHLHQISSFNSKSSHKASEGQEIRVRVCPGAGDCPGEARMVRPCSSSSLQPCRGSWSDWAAWTSCSRTCGSSTELRTRSRICPSGEGKCGVGSVKEVSVRKIATIHEWNEIEGRELRPTSLLGVGLATVASVVDLLSQLWLWD